MSLEIATRIASVMGHLADKKLTPEQRAAYKKQLSDLSRKQAILQHQIGSYRDILEDEETFAEQSGIEGGYTP